MIGTMSLAMQAGLCRLGHREAMGDGIYLPAEMLVTTVLVPGFALQNRRLGVATI
jgi:hypothetical protein